MVGGVNLAALHDRTAERIAALGNPVTLQILPGHDHWIYDIGPALAYEAWAFFQSTTNDCSENC